jgi:hypothetical protein
MKTRKQTLDMPELPVSPWCRACEPRTHMNRPSESAVAPALALTHPSSFILHPWFPEPRTSPRRVSPEADLNPEPFSNLRGVKPWHGKEATSP